ncbi:DUF3263 domain-containing protein [Pedococcus bigeumensis]|uniref:DUF3263 domain-containing protein n=1 Tax=Pedococcus bigeumensis TaxID=433644 RepID=A0A502CJB6_9MICO|nr:DUF3263 domain-containing protein [Pedococcus bigeumensis]TPG12903.1 DUF3263 domain-containing protein [Pedococcus bigeumensis]
MEELSARQRDILDFEAGTFAGAGSKEQAIRTRFGVGATNYYQQLNALLDSEAALAHDPLLVNRLRRLRARNQRSRTPRRNDFTEPTAAPGSPGPSHGGP